MYTSPKENLQNDISSIFVDDFANFLHISIHLACERVALTPTNFNRRSSCLNIETHSEVSLLLVFDAKNVVINLCISDAVFLCFKQT